MSRASIFFLVVVAMGLAILLALLGLATMRSNLLGGFLLLTGLIYFFGVIILYWIRRIRFWAPRTEGEIRKAERNDRSFWMIVIAMIAVFYLPPLEYLFMVALLPRGLWMQITGLLLVSLGSALLIWARRALGKFYSGHLSVIEGQSLVRHGPYRLIRHPAYAGYLLISGGLAFGFSSLVGFVAILFFLLPSVIYRIQTEDQLLAAYFGTTFIEYASRTRRLIPGIW